MKNDAVEQYAQLKRDVASLRKQEVQQQERMRLLKEQLKEEFGCTSIKQAERKLKKLQAQQREAEQQYEKLLEAFYDRWEEKMA